MRVLVRFRPTVIVTRTVFLRLIGVAIAGTRLDPVAFAAGFSLDAADASHFQPLVGQTFSVFPESGSMRARLRLEKVIDGPPSKAFSQFSLIFHAADGDAIPDGVHAFHHSALGSVSMFISSIGAPAGVRRVYQVCISRHVRI